MTISRLVVGVDGSDNGHAAAEFGANLARELGAEAVVVHAAGMLEQPPHDELRATFENQWCRPFDDAAVPTTKLLRDGSPVEVLLRVADEEGADLVVVGSRGLGTHPDLLLGSTSTQVAQRSTHPVVIVPTRAR